MAVTMKDGFAAAAALGLPTECRDEFARIFAGVPQSIRPGETERQYDQRVADELRAARRAAAERVA